jgi:hypothetical protein
MRVSDPDKRRRDERTEGNAERPIRPMNDCTTTPRADVEKKIFQT